jgi:hypothetical protein
MFVAPTFANDGFLRAVKADSLGDLPLQHASAPLAPSRPVPFASQLRMLVAPAGVGGGRVALGTDAIGLAVLARHAAPPCFVALLLSINTRSTTSLDGARLTRWPFTHAIGQA